jgi:hypothetical protein
VTVEVRIDGLPETCGIAAVVAVKTYTLSDLATVYSQAPYLLTRARSRYGNPNTVVSA